jgi:TonB family protein
MKKIIEVTLLLGLLGVPAFAQDSKPPFYLLDKEVKERRSGWNGSHEELSTIFNAERIRLGVKFETELIKYLGRDIEKHDWISSFLECPDYLHGNKPLPQLSLLIKQQAISILHGKTDHKSRGNTMKLSVTAAVLSEKLGLHSLAEVYKKESQRILKSDPDFGGWFPAMDKYEICLYDSLNGPRNTPCNREVAENDRNRSRIPSIGGMLNGKAISLPSPVYPEEARAKGISGTVEVEIVIDEEGKVEFARGLSGDPVLQEAALIAVRRARFSLTQMSGQPVKVSGRVMYNFVQ